MTKLVKTSDFQSQKIVPNGVQENSDIISGLNLRIIGYKTNLNTIMLKEYPNQRVVITSPYEIQDNSVTHLIVSEMIASTLIEVYGPHYTLPSTKSEKNMQQLTDGALLPTLFLLVQKKNADEKTIRAILQNQISEVVGVSAFLPKQDGFLEIGRLAKRKHYKIPGNLLALSNISSWYKNQDGLMTDFHTLIADLRASKAHGDILPSYGSQKAFLRDADAKIVTFGPFYGIKDRKGEELRENFLEVRRPRSKEIWEPSPIYLPPNVDTDSINLLTELTRHQFGNPLPIIKSDISQENTNPYTIGEQTFSRYDSHKAIAVSLNPTSSEKKIDLLNIVNVEQNAEQVLIGIPATKDEGVATINFFMKNGYRICGFEPGYNASYNAGKNYNASPVIYMLRFWGDTEKIAPLFLIQELNQPLRRQIGILDQHIRTMTIKR